MLRDTLLWIRALLVSIPGIALVTVLGTLAALLGAFSAGWIQKVRPLWARALLAVAFTRIEAGGSFPESQSGNFIISCNHLSYLDPPVIAAFLDRPANFIAKQSLFTIPFLGWGMRLAGDISLDRDNSRAAARSIVQAEKLLRLGRVIVVFPEGGRSPDGRLQPFLSGAFRLAIRAQAPIVPVAIIGTREALRPGSLLLRGGRVSVRIGEPIPSTGYSMRDHAVLSERVEEATKALLGAAG